LKRFENVAGADLHTFPIGAALDIRGKGRLIGIVKAGEGRNLATPGFEI
jgi:hypothetical protein